LRVLAARSVGNRSTSGANAMSTDNTSVVTVGCVRCLVFGCGGVANLSPARPEARHVFDRGL
jgi:hypothetical protein